MPIFRFAYEIAALLVLLAWHFWLLRQWNLQSPVRKILAAGSLLLGGSSLLISPAVWSAAAEGNGQILRAVALLWALLAPAFLSLWYFSQKRIPASQPGRRTAIRSLAALPVAGVGYGILLGRRDFRVSEQNLVFQALPPAFDGLRIVQLTDIHYGPFLGMAELQRIVGMANELNGDLIALTGDFITRTSELLPECLVGLGALRARGPILGCMGNHESYAKCEDWLSRETAKLGWRFLRQDSMELFRGQEKIRISGVDYVFRRSEYLRGCEKLIDKNGFNLLLAHNPDMFPQAARLGFDLTLSGHTHGGQVDVELFDQHLNIVRAFTPYTKGLFELQGKRCFVSAGLGTIGVPLRIGAPPEVALIRLCAS